MWLKTKTGIQGLFQYAAEDHYRFCNGILYRVLEENGGKEPDAFLLSGTTEEPLVRVSGQFADPDTAFAFIRKNGDALNQILQELRI